MVILFEGHMHVHYAQFYVESGGAGFEGDMDATFRAQRNGLCGAAVPGALFLTTGLHTGSVTLRVERHDGEPPLDDTFEDIVEVSFRPNSAQVAIEKWGGTGTYPLDLQLADYRVRYSGRGMDAAFEQDTSLEDEPTIDAYLLQFWPAAPAPDRVVKQTSVNAAYRHDYARVLKPSALL